MLTLFSAMGLAEKSRAVMFHPTDTTGDSLLRDSWGRTSACRDIAKRTARGASTWRPGICLPGRCRVDSTRPSAHLWPKPSRRCRLADGLRCAAQWREDGANISDSSLGTSGVIREGKSNPVGEIESPLVEAGFVNVDCDKPRTDHGIVTARKPVAAKISKARVRFLNCLLPDDRGRRC
jgi:hypothetical protein